MKKRQNGEGTIYQTKTGLWRCEITLGYDADKKRIKKTVSSRSLEELQKKINDLKYLNDRRMIANPQNTTISEWLAFWLETYKKTSVKPTTYDMYYDAVNTYLIPLLGHYKIDKLNTISVQKMINDISASGKSGKPLSLSTLKKILLTLSQSYDRAIKLNMVYQNPCDNVVLPKAEKKKALSFTGDEQERFLKLCDSADTSYKCLFITAFNTGMRLGELLALTWSDVDLDNEFIHVDKNLTLVRDFSENEREYQLVIGSTKTDSGGRDIPMTRQAAKAVRSQADRNTDGSQFVFYSQTGTPLMKRNVYRVLNKMLVAAEVTSPVTFHSMRHSFATRLLEKGADIKTVSTLLGHRSIQITLDIYSHVSSDLKKSTISLLDD